MSETNLNETPNHEPDTPRLEPWLVVLLLSMVPMLAAFAARDFVYHLATISGILFAAGLGMLMVQERRRR